MRGFMKRVKILTVLLLVFPLLFSGAQSTLFADNDGLLKETGEPTKLHSLGNLTKNDIPTELLRNINLELTDDMELDTFDEEALDMFTIKKEGFSSGLYLFDSNVKFKDDDGSIKFIDNSIILTEKEDKQYAFRNKANDIKNRFPIDISTGVKMEKGNYGLTVIPVTKEGVQQAQKTSSGFKGEKQEVVQYNNAFGEGSYLQYIPVDNGMKESIILDYYTGQNTFSFKIEVGKLIPVIHDGTWIDFEDPDTKDVIIRISSAYAEDSYTGKYDGAEHYTENIKYAIKRLGDGAWLFTMTVDETFLASSTTVYPILIDPYYYYYGDASNFEDTCWYENKVYAYNTSNVFCVGKDDTSANKGDCISYIRTKAMSKMKHIKPESITQVALYLNETYNSSGSSYIYAYNCTNSNINIASTNLYNTMSGMAVSANEITYQWVSSSYQNYPWFWWNITTVFKNWLKYERGEGGYTQKRGIILKAQNKTSPLKSFPSSDSASTSKRPYIRVDYKQTGNILYSTNSPAYGGVGPGGSSDINYCLQGIGYFSSITPNLGSYMTCKYMGESDVFVIISHGFAGRVNCAGSTLSALKPPGSSDQSIAEEYGSGQLSKLKFAYFGSCKSAATDTNYGNLAEYTVNTAGAQCSLGFKYDVALAQATWFEQQLFYYLATGTGNLKTVSGAALKALDDVDAKFSGNLGGTDSYKIYGNKNTILQ